MDPRNPSNGRPTSSNGSVTSNGQRASSQYRHQALLEIKKSLIPFSLEQQPSDRPNSSNYASSASSSSPQRGSSPIAGYTSNGRPSSVTTLQQQQQQQRASIASSSSGTQSSSCNPLSSMPPQAELTQKLKALTMQQQQQHGTNGGPISANHHVLNHLNNNTQSSHHLLNHSSTQPPSYTHSPASLSSLYSSVTSYAASSSSGRQSPTPTISSSSEYSSVPPSMLHLTKLLSPASCSSQASSISATSSVAASVISSKNSNFGSATAINRPGGVSNAGVQAWRARQAKTQSPVIMQSVKSTHVQKPVLQTAVAPSQPVPQPVPLPGTTSSSLNTSSAIKINGAIANGCVPSRGESPALNHLPPKSSLPPSVLPPKPVGVQSTATAAIYLNPERESSNPPPYPSKHWCPNGQVNGNVNAAAQKPELPARNVLPPPPPYASAVQEQKVQQANGASRRTGKTFEIECEPPAPPPPPYTATLATVTQDEIVHGYPIVPQSRPSIPTPAVDPPSYASSVAALAKQRGTKTNSQIPARPPPPLPLNGDQGNGVDGPTLPPKPSDRSMQTPSVFNDTASITDSECSSVTSVSNMSLLSNLTSTNSMPIASSGAPRRPAPLPPSPTASSTVASSDVTSDSQEKPITHQSPMPERRIISKEREQERKETKVRNYSPAAFKFFMEQHIENVEKSYCQRQRRRQELEAFMVQQNFSEADQENMRKVLQRKESNYIRLKRAKMNKTMFTVIKKIGNGAFGEVSLVRKVNTHKLYAMKTLRKSDVLNRNQVAHVKAERDILAEADNEWVVKLYYSFQDADQLYFVMDYIPGGDLMNLLVKLQIFDEKLAQFYIAELVLALESVHKMGFIHRDIKPDNILIDKNGHIKLTDFGLCTGFRWTHNSKYYQRNDGIDTHNRQDSMEADDFNCIMDSRGPPNNLIPNGISKPLERRRKRCLHQRCQAHSLVGTPNYIAPEVLMRTGYTQSCDWWSVGVILYEMVVGSPPFHADTPQETQNRVIHWKTELQFPMEPRLSDESIDLIVKWCCGPGERLGRNGADEIKKHPFFKSIDFDRSDFRQQPAPYVPQIIGETDTSNFDLQEEDHIGTSSEVNGRDRAEDYVNGDRQDYNGKHPDHAFFEFTFRRFFDDDGHALDPFPFRSKSEDSSKKTSSQGSDNAQASPVYV